MTPRPAPAPVSEWTPEQIVAGLVAEEVALHAGDKTPLPTAARIRLDAVHVGARVVTAYVMAGLPGSRARLYAEAVTLLDGPDGIARVQDILRDIADAADREARA